LTATIQAAPVPESPYRGIESFRYIDQQIFSARESETWDLLSNILLYRGVLLYGDSGSGKTSLVNAGLIPAAIAENLLPNRLRIQPRRGREIRLERIPIESEDAPPFLPSTFIEEGSDEARALGVELSITDFYDRLSRLKSAPAGPARPLLIFDQFEEFITLFEEALRGGETEQAKLAQKEAPEIQQAILKTITSLLEDDALPIKVIFVFREDYLAKLDMLFEANPALLDQYVRLLPPRVEEAEKIIRAPFVDEQLKEKFAARSEGKGGGEITEELAATIASQLEGRTDGGFINLSELQIVCRRLSQADDPVKFFESRGENIQTVLEDYWSEVLKKLGNLYEPAIALLGHMVTSSNTRNIVSEPDLKNYEKDNFTHEQIAGALEALVERKLVRREPRHKIYFYEIASEFLVPWINEKKAGRLAEIEARKLAAESAAQLREARRHERNLKYLGVALGTLMMIAAGVALYMTELSRVAKDAETNLQVERDRLSNIINLLKRLNSENPQDQLDAVQELNALAENGRLPPELAPLILATFVNNNVSNEGNEEPASSEEDKAVFEAATELLPLAVRSAKKELGESIISKAAESNKALVKKLPPRFYIHIYDEGQRARADKIGAALKSKGFSVPSYDIAGARTPRKNQLRHYDSAGGPDPNEVIKIIEAADRQNWESVALPLSKKSRPGHFEIWFANAAPPAQTGVLTLKFEDDKGYEISVPELQLSLVDKKAPGKVLSYAPTTREATGFNINALVGEYELTVVASGYERQRLTVTIEAGKKIIKITMLPSVPKVQQYQQQQQIRKKN
jgi:hypothetical protein